MCSWELRVRGHRRVTDMDVGDWASSNKSSHADKNTAPIQIPKSKSSETQNFLVLYLSSKCDLTLKCWCPYITWTVRPFFFPLTVSIRIFTEKTFMDLNLGHLHNTWYIHHITVLKFEKKKLYPETHPVPRVSEKGLWNCDKYQLWNWHHMLSTVLRMLH